MLRLGSSYSRSSPLIPPEVNAAELLGQRDLEEMPRVIEMIERYGEDRQSIIDALQRDEWPIPDARNWENYAPGYDIAYWISGYVHYRLLSKTAEKHGVDGGRCYDFGGSSGRVCRHFAIQSDAWDVWLSDFKEYLGRIRRRLSADEHQAVPQFGVPVAAAARRVF